MPAVDRLLLMPATYELTTRYGRSLVLEALRITLDAYRTAIIGGQREAPMNATIVQDAREWLEALVAPTLRPVINAMGVIVHTNLGRAPLSRAATAAVAAAAEGYGTVEYDLQAGTRGSRRLHAAPLLARLTNAEAALVVNNNAAAVLLMLAGLCRGREVLISRGQLVEIGGGFRVPDVMAQSGARLVEVGTTNRTHLRDYADAITPETAAILVAHPSNFKMIGFTSTPTLQELAELAHRHQLLLLYDQGSGALLDTAPYGLAHEPTVPEAIADGADVVAFSGDKLLGGPQAGILCGRRPLIVQLARHPLARAVRPDKLCLAALAATLTHYLTGEATTAIPVWRMIARPADELKETAERWAAWLQGQGVTARAVEGASTVGGGSLPGASLPTWLLAIDGTDVTKLAARLRTTADPPVIGRIQDGRLLFDPRTVLPEQEAHLLASLAEEMGVPQPPSA
ncbi:MAG: L-seryl-tRNA(Sec) selenium transferase [Candidatus Promineifilaceae bacterium]|nr:L-seryl-tRNA(Sec) selenium transferase [Candidatus Promineifilaceae bacterium]